MTGDVPNVLPRDGKPGRSYGGKTGQWDRTCLENSVGVGKMDFLGPINWVPYLRPTWKGRVTAIKERASRGVPAFGACQVAGRGRRLSLPPW